MAYRAQRQKPGSTRITSDVHNMHLQPLVRTESKCLFTISLVAFLTKFRGEIDMLLDIVNGN